MKPNHCPTIDEAPPQGVGCAMPPLAAKKLNNRRDVLLLLLYSPGRGERVNEPISGRTRLTKMLFLFKEEVPPHFRKGTQIDSDNFYQFFAWDFGPFSAQVYDDLTFFMLRGFIQSSISKDESLPESAAEWEKWQAVADTNDHDEYPEYEEEEFSLTPKGVEFTAGLFEQLSSNQKTLLQEFKVRTGTASLRALLRYVYQRYPNQTTKSK